ncbi:L,D-transpeptidase family protein [Streptomyces sp. 2A115]|uniref:L,D-transpeptidase family protein n=1 Tax=Streptomyces sp. 2A115 TaxID=3457439 RepID=UPI003FD4D722
MVCRVRHRTVAALLAVVVLLPVQQSAVALPVQQSAVALPVQQSAVAAPPPAPPAPGAPASLGELVPGVPPGPYHPWPLDTPDQALAPKVYTPTAEEDAVEPWDAAAESDALIEYVPISDAVARHAGRVVCSKRTGPYQRQVERWLRRTVDGKQSPKDCVAIRRFQTRQGIRPDNGFAGPVTWARMTLLSAKRNPNAAGKCPVRTYRTACVDLTRQLTWVQQGKKVLFGPVAVRSGRAGYRTRTGRHRIYWKHKNHWSSLYNTPMPYSQFFSRGQAFHAIRGSVHNPPGSMGCVNLSLADARTLWSVLRKGDRVYLWGRRPGT